MSGRSCIRGHEIACHTVLHPTIERCPVEQTALQVLEDREESGARGRLSCAGAVLPQRFLQQGDTLSLAGSWH